MSCQKLSCKVSWKQMLCHVCCMMRTSKQPYPDDDIELVHLERTSFSVKEHEKSDGYNNTNNRLIVWKPSSPYLRMVWILDEMSLELNFFVRSTRRGVKVRSSRCRISLMMELGSADLVFLCFVCFWRE